MKYEEGTRILDLEHYEIYTITESNNSITKYTDKNLITGQVNTSKLEDYFNVYTKQHS